jgi:hypothetical protein
MEGLEKIEFKFKYEVGEDVVLNNNRVGVITKRWAKIIKLSEEEYGLIKSYTAQPIETKHNQQRILEKDIITIKECMTN